MGYCIEHLPSRLSIGRETETGVTDIRIDCTDWLERWPGMVVAAIFCPPGGTPYILDTEMSGNSLVWHVRDTDTATPGIGQMELTGEADGKRKLSALVDVQVARRLPGTAGDTPDPAQPWVDSVLGAAERITGMQVATETLEAGSDATAQWDGEAGVLTLGIPRVATYFEVDETLTLENGVLSVNRAEKMEKDNSLPITSAAVYTEVGNINALLETI